MFRAISYLAACAAVLAGPVPRAQACTPVGTWVGPIMGATYVIWNRKSGSVTVPGCQFPFALTIQSSMEGFSFQAVGPATNPSCSATQFMGAVTYRKFLVPPVPHGCRTAYGVFEAYSGAGNGTMLRVSSAH